MGMRQSGNQIFGVGIAGRWMGKEVSAVSDPFEWAVDRIPTKTTTGGFGCGNPNAMSKDPAHENVETLRKAYSLWHESRGGSVEHWLGLMAEDVTIRSLASAAKTMEFAQPRDGRAEARHYFTALAAEWEMVRFTAEEFIAQGDRVVVLSRCAFRSRRTGREVESPKADVFRLRDGQIVEVMEFFDTAQAAVAAGALS